MIRVPTLLIILATSCAFCSGQGKSPFRQNLELTQRSVVFLYPGAAFPNQAPIGTGFVVGVPRKSNPTQFYAFLVTARHIADPEWMGCHSPRVDTVARFNKAKFNPAGADSGTVDYPLTIAETKWKYTADDSVDIAFTPINAGRL